MEKEAINLLRENALGIELWADGPFSWSLRIGLYWFGVMFCMRWYRPGRYVGWELEPWTGFVFAWKLNPDPKEGALIWLNRKEWGRYAA